MSKILGCKADGQCHIVKLNEQEFWCYAADSIDAIRLARQAAGMPISTIKPDARLATADEVAILEASQDEPQLAAADSADSDSADGESGIKMDGDQPIRVA